MPAADARRSRRRSRLPPSGSSPAQGRLRPCHPVLVLLAALLAYHGSFTVPFLFDDVGIVDTRELRQLWSWKLVTGTTRPLVQLSLAVNYALGGLDVVGYHLVNLAIHVAAALALYGIAACTLVRARPGTPWHDEAAEIALAVSLIWAVHPLQTESVTYVVQRAESLMALCYLLTLYGVIRGAASAHPSGWYLTAVAACGLGMLSKPVMVTAPLTVALYDRTFLAASWREVGRERARLYAALATTWILLLLILAGPHESATTAGFTMRDLSWDAYARSQPGVIAHYLRLAVWPSPLVLDYGWPVANDAAAVVLPLLALAALAALTAWASRRHPEVGMLGVMFWLALLPSSSVIPIRDLAFEHRMYLPLAPLVALAVLATRWLIAQAALGPRRERRLAAALVAGVVVVLTSLTIARQRDYASAIAMWTDVVAKRPANARAHGNLGQALNQAGRGGEAIGPLETALRLDPHYVDARINLGNALASQRRYDDAETQFAEALRLDPTAAKAHNNWGVALVRQGKSAEAEAHYRAALRLRPDYAEAENNLGVALADQGRLAEAKTRYRAAIDLAPGYAEAVANLGNLFTREGKPAEAVAYYRRALELAPAVAEVHFNFALALAALGQRDEARAHAAEAARLKPELQSVVRMAGLP